MKIKQNLHIHSHHSCDSGCAKLRDIKVDHEALGVEHFAVTDHLHTRYNISDIESCRHAFLGCNFPANFHFGIEASLVACWERDKIIAGDYIARGDVPIYGFRDDVRPFDGNMCMDLDEKDIEKYGIEFVVGGIHWPLGYPDTRSGIIDNYFAQQMFLAEHPLVDVVAHPWDSISLAAGDWFLHRDKKADWSIYAEIPQEMNDKLGEAILKNGKFAEINLPCVLKVPEEVTHFCMSAFRNWRDAGVKFTIGSDQHSAHPDTELFAKAEVLLDKYGFKEEDFSLPFEIK